ncbi:hypothetical protein SAMN04244573_03584 [Azotobacter beijerinckii]|uniref:Uncharacterized protein n=2 Tax=Azotobacter beijerinckii TaxID=170623 RepID=A0A1H9P0D6_9GAMM|nr:hypothetical protein SAMN04244573_03584 [Azotobacter beijerinckii]
MAITGACGRLRGWIWCGYRSPAGSALRMSTPSPQLGHYALGGILASILLNLLLRTFVKVGGLFATLLVAGLVAAGLAQVFAWRNRRAPLPAERRGIVLRYGLGLGVLYLGLLAMMEHESPHGPVGLMLFGLHYACYPALAWVALGWRGRNDAGQVQ